MKYFGFITLLLFLLFLNYCTMGNEDSIHNAVNKVDSEAENSSVCGNNIKEYPEECDDGDTLSGDGCSPVCQIEYGSLSDLGISAFSLSSYSIQDGNTVTATVEISNTGTGIARNFRYGIYLSSTDSITSSDNLLYSEEINELQPGSSYGLASIPITISGISTIGYYTIGIIVDDLDNVIESSEDNNKYIDPKMIDSTTQSSVDLIVDSIVLSSYSVTAGSNINVTRQFSNIGQNSVYEFRYGVYLSSDITISTSDILLFSDTQYYLSANGTGGPAEISVPIPINTSSGNYYVGIIVDDLSEVSELNEQNNSSYEATPLAISSFTPSALTLGNWTVDSINAGEVKWFSFPAIGGNSYAITWDGKYYGSGNFTAHIKVSAYHADGVTLYFDKKYSSYNQQQIINPSVSEQVYLKVEGYYTDSSGTFGIKAFTGSPDLAPDLTVKTVGLSSSSVNAGELIDVTFQFSNIGNIDASDFNYGIYLSTDTTIDLSDTSLYSYSFSSLAAGSNSNITTKSIRLPVVTTAGDYYIGSIVDNQSAITESNESNNFGYDSSAITVIGTSVTALTLGNWSDDSITSGEVVWYSISVTSGNLYNLTWDDSYEGSGNYTGDIKVFAYKGDGVTQLFWGSNSGYFYPKSFTSAETGTAYIRVEGYTPTSNGNYRLKIFQESGSPDLIVDSVVLSSYSVSAGDTINVTSQLSNAGGSSVSYFYYALYLSPDVTITTSDTFLYEGSVDGLVPGGDILNDNTIQVPVNLSSGSYYIGAVADYKLSRTESDETNNSGYDITSVTVNALSPVTLTMDSWTDANLISDEGKWFTFPASADTVYFISWDDSFQGTGVYTADIKVTAYEYNGLSLFFENQDHGYSNPATLSSNSNGTVYIKVVGWDSSGSGTFSIKVQ